MMEIIPSPGTADKTFDTIEKKLLAVKGLVKTVHIDIIDGYFAANKTFSDPTPFARYATDLPAGQADLPAGRQGFNLEIHLMVHDPAKHIKPWADVGATRFIGQIEKMPDQVEFVAQAQLFGEASLGIDLQTPVSHIKIPFIDLDAILIMGVMAGFSGQKFNEEAFEKIRNLHGKTDIPIELDGGVNDGIIKLAADAGATRFVASSFLFDKGKSPKEQLQVLEKSLEN